MGRAYVAVSQAGSVLHTMLQVFHAKLLHELDESGPNIDAFNELRTATNLALHATKAIAQTIGREEIKGI